MSLEELLPQSVLIAFAFLLGSVIGSFLNVVIHRVPREMSIANPPSHCPHCQYRLQWYWNLPLLGWLMLRGRCRNCRAPISIRYPIVELLTGLLAVAVLLQYGPTPWAIFQFAFVAALVAVTYIDIDHMIIPDVISLPGIAVGLVGQLLLPEGEFLLALIAVLAGGGGLLFIAWAHEKIRGVEGMGGGDIKLLAMIGAFTSPIGVLQTILVGSLVGSVIGIAYLAISRKGGETHIPFGPFLAFGAITFVLQPHWLERLLTGDMLLLSLF
jgi:leader peptidase (prepilin peptidase) / N-methyltransferase